MRAIREWMEATAAEMKASTYHDIPESKRYCGFCGQGDSEIGLENLVEGPTCCICIDCAEDAASSIRSRTQKSDMCEHEWVDARNSVVVSGEYCPKCHAVRAGNSGDMCHATASASGETVSAQAPLQTEFGADAKRDIVYCDGYLQAWREWCSIIPDLTVPTDGISLADLDKMEDRKRFIENIRFSAKRRSPDEEPTTEATPSAPRSDKPA
jgi:hypothetical protein